MLILKKVARIISDLFIPPTFVLLGFIFIALETENHLTNTMIVISSAIIFGVMLPILLFVILRKKKVISDNDAVIKEQRHLPYYTSIALNLLGMIYLLLLTDNSFASYYWLILTFNTAGLTLINHFWKISAHAIGVSTFVSLLYFLNSDFFVYFVVILISVGLSRFLLKVHTPSQIILGTIYGFFVTLLQLNIFLGN